MCKNNYKIVNMYFYIKIVPNFLQQHLYTTSYFWLSSQQNMYVKHLALIKTISKRYCTLNYISKLH